MPDDAGKKIGNAYIKVSPNSDGFSEKAKTDVSEGMKGAESSVHESAGRMKETFKGMAAAFGLAFGVEKVVEFGKSVLEAGEENIKLSAQTGAVIKSTGGAAGVTTGQIEDLSMAISKNTAVSDNAIQNGANLLLTFTNIRNETGKGNDVFNQATQTITDMSAALGQDMQSSAVQVGKALNDPIKGITALSRVGVTFTAQQKDQITAMVKAGDTMGAQKLILGELNREFGGSAAAQATATDKLKNYIGILEENLGQKLMPILDKVAEFLMKYLPPALDFAGQAFDAIRQAVTPIIEEYLPKFIKVWKDDLQPVLEKVEAFVQAHLRPILIALGVALGLIFAPVTTVVAAFLVLYARFAVVREIVADVVKAFGAFVRFIEVNVIPIVRKIAEYVGEQFSHLEKFVQSHMAAVQEAIGHVMTVVRVVIMTALHIIEDLWDTFGSNILKIAEAVFDQIKLVVQTAIRIIRDVIDVVLDLINGDWGKAWKALRDIFGAFWDYIKGTLGNALKIVGQLLDAGLKVVEAIFGGAWRAVTGGVTSFIGSIVGFFERLPGQVIGAVSRLNGDINGFFARVFSDVINAIIHGTQNAVSWFASLPGSIIRALGNVDRLLVDAGERIIKGLINGFKNMFGEVKHTLGNLGHDLVSWKGPPEYDAVLLTDNGERIINGFVAGIKNRIPDVKKVLNDVTKTVANTSVGMTVNGSSNTSSSTAASIASGAGLTVNINGVFDFTTPDGARKAAIAINKALADYQRERAA